MFIVTVSSGINVFSHFNTKIKIWKIFNFLTHEIIAIAIARLIFEQRVLSSKIRKVFKCEGNSSCKI